MPKDYAKVDDNGVITQMYPQLYWADGSGEAPPEVYIPADIFPTLIDVSGSGAQVGWIIVDGHAVPPPPPPYDPTIDMIQLRNSRKDWISRLSVAGFRAIVEGDTAEIQAIYNGQSDLLAMTTNSVLQGATGYMDFYNRYTAEIERVLGTLSAESRAIYDKFDN